MTTADTTLEIVREHLNIESVSVDQTFGDLGADSLDVVEISMAIEAQFGIGAADFGDDWGYDTKLSVVVGDTDAAALLAKAA